MTDGMDVGKLGSLGGVSGNQLNRSLGVGKTQQSFKDVLFESIDKVDQLQHEADTAMDRFATGKTNQISEVLMAAQKADLAFKTLMQIRNRIMTAYQEINQMRL